MPPTIDQHLRELADTTHEQLNPSPDLLGRIRASTGRHRRSGARAASLLGLAAAAVILTAVVVTQPSRHVRREPVAPAPASAPIGQLQLYWQDFAGIGGASLDGAAVIPGLIPFNGGSAQAPACGVAVDRTYVYWTTEGSTLARARRDGTGVDNNFIVTAPMAADCVAVDSAHVYWADATSGLIGRANLDGTGVQAIIPGANAVCGIAVDGSHIYWANRFRDSIGRANLDGTGVTQNFLTGVEDSPSAVGATVCGLVVDSAHIYWGTSDGSVGRANLDGTGKNTRFISGPGVYDSYTVICGENGGYLYWTSAFPGPPNAWIGRARLDGKDVKANLISGVRDLSGCAVGP